MAVMDTMTLFIALVFVLAGLVKGVTGMGLPTVAVALLSLKMAPLEAAALLIVPSALTNVWQLATGPALYPLWRRLRPMLLATCVGTAIGGWLLLAPGGTGTGAEAAVWTPAVLGVLLAGYGVLGLSGWRGKVPAAAQRWAGPLAGVATGAIASTTGVFIMPSAPYLQALDLNREDLVQALGLSFTVSTLALAAMLAWRGGWHANAATGSLLALLPAALGIVAGQWLRQRMSAEVFRRCFFVALIGLGVHQCVRAAMAG
ncbi:sulfite exporter TauE/SafE family protein [Duganella sp. Leaf61]|uniref:sulfite exporter TauE/SafE family protein n=1 Tax=Duganella sp. Leaf61 TaxID=1736227 RepID=UPI0009EC88C3|nr:sulfite exporter TauE/SafE family protein [Duganella sp. Leaf61]